MKESDHKGQSRVIEFMDSFKVRGVNGEHTCMVFEVLGCTLLKLIMNTSYTGLPVRDGIHHRLIVQISAQSSSGYHKTNSTGT